MKLTMTPELIYNSIRKDPQHCPIGTLLNNNLFARGLAEYTYNVVYEDSRIGIATWRTYVGENCYMNTENYAPFIPLSESCFAFVRAYDRGELVEPVEVRVSAEVFML
jgi:hypothetical protein